MATKTKKSTAKKADSTETVTRITAKTAGKSAKKSPKTPQKAVATPTEERKKNGNPLAAIGGYFAGAWYELKQVRWPNRKATWSMTAAMLGFTAFFVVIILLLDAAFKYLFEIILG